jgi:exopolysaccharide biosynthesis predicted pyruvyltransferase EpsI
MFPANRCLSMKIDVPTFLSEWLADAGDAYFYPNPGNAGDALITSATWEVFDGLNFVPKLLPGSAFVPRHCHVVLGGGGNLVSYYRDIARVLERCLDGDIKRCLLLPHTVRGHEDLLARLDDRFTLICRDVKSFDHVQKYAPRARALLGRDMATYLDFKKLEMQVRKIDHKLALLGDVDWLWRSIGWKLALARCQRGADGKLVLLRADKESAAPDRDPRLDLMRHYRGKMRGRAACDQVSQDIIGLLRKAKSVTTDRLHLALPSIMLGIEVTMLENSYGKLGDVCATAFDP